tara:strand:- start:1147 stop:1878 length:732 start_codon:yes stop_codon:yes gene_type:complete
MSIKLLGSLFFLSVLCFDKSCVDSFIGRGMNPVGYRNSLSLMTRFMGTRPPLNKTFSEMDMFDKFENYSMSGNNVMATNQLFSIRRSLSEEADNKNKNNTNRVSESDVKILNVDWVSLVEDMDSQFYQELNISVPRAPRKEEEIEEDSFEGYLRGEFRQISFDDKVNFETFYYWKCSKGLILTRDETYGVYQHCSDNNDLCGLMEFITLNNIIDERNAADYSLMESEFFDVSDFDDDDDDDDI